MIFSKIVTVYLFSKFVNNFKIQIIALAYISLYDRNYVHVDILLDCEHTYKIQICAREVQLNYLHNANVIQISPAPKWS